MSLENQISRMKKLMGVSDNKSINESKEKPRGVEYYATGADGKIYGILREGTHYYIKTTTSDKELIGESFSYIGGITRKKDYQYKSCGKAIKQLELKLQSLNEAHGVEGDTQIINPTKRGNVVLETTKQMKDEIARQKGLMKITARTLNEGLQIEPEGELYDTIEMDDDNEVELSDDVQIDRVEIVGNFEIVPISDETEVEMEDEVSIEDLQGGDEVEGVTHEISIEDELMKEGEDVDQEVDGVVEESSILLDGDEEMSSEVIECDVVEESELTMNPKFGMSKFGGKPKKGCVNENVDLAYSYLEKLTERMGEETLLGNIFQYLDSDTLCEMFEEIANQYDIALNESISEDIEGNDNIEEKPKRHNRIKSVIDDSWLSERGFGLFNGAYLALKNIKSTISKSEDEAEIQRLCDEAGEKIAIINPIIRNYMNGEFEKNKSINGRRLSDSQYEELKAAFENASDEDIKTMNDSFNGLKGLIDGVWDKKIGDKLDKDFKDDEASWKGKKDELNYEKEIDKNNIDDLEKSEKEYYGESIESITSMVMEELSKVLKKKVN